MSDLMGPSIRVLLLLVARNEILRILRPCANVHWRLLPETSSSSQQLCGVVIVVVFVAPGVYTRGAK
eukprot:5581597-Pyramimonas_sp.AAC.1